MEAMYIWEEEKHTEVKYFSKLNVKCFKMLVPYDENL